MLPYEKYYGHSAAIDRITQLMLLGYKVECWTEQESGIRVWKVAIK